MKKFEQGEPETKSQDVKEGNLRILKELFPEAFSEGCLDPKILVELLPNGSVDEREEKYGLNWHGKRQARQIALSPSTGTLRPCPEESVNWDTTENIMIEGDNLEVLKLLQKSYAGKVKLIYIDPPYNTGNDFVYRDDFRDNLKNYLEVSGQISSEGQVSTSNSETSGRFHTNWLNMMYPRLKLARSLLSDDGVICISIDDTEQANLKKICDGIYGEENHLSTIVWQKRYVSNVTAKWLSDMHDFILIYARNRDQVSISSWDRTETQLEAYKNPDNDSRGPWRAQDLSASKPYSAGQFTIIGPTSLSFDPPPNRYWRCNRVQFDAWVAENRIWWGVNRDARPMLKSFLSESTRGITPNTWWDHKFAGHNKEATLELKELFEGDAPFDTPKPVRLIRRLIELFCNGGEIVMDFFCGSAPLAQAVMEFVADDKPEPRFIVVQFPEETGRSDYATIADIAKERIRRVGQKITRDKPLLKGDFGFRVFKLDSSNISAWDPDGDNLKQDLIDSIEHIKSDRGETDVLYELLLKLGLDLCVPIDKRTVNESTIYCIGAGALFVCLSSKVLSGDVEMLALGIIEWHRELNPPGESSIVFRDSSFSDDVTKTNLTAILQQHGLENIRSL